MQLQVISTRVLMQFLRAAGAMQDFGFTGVQCRISAEAFAFVYSGDSVDGIENTRVAFLLQFVPNASFPTKVSHQLKQIIQTAYQSVYYAEILASGLMELTRLLCSPSGMSSRRINITSSMTRRCIQPPL